MKSLKDLIKDGDAQGIKKFMGENNLVLDGNKIVPRDESVVPALKARAAFWDQRQQARKILLNSLYGALLNEALRFYDERMGQSVTLTGRSIVRHMNAKINETLTGDYDYTGPAICYADTDSCYFSAAKLLDADNMTREDFIEIYKEMAEATNESFPGFMHETFNTGRERGAIIAAGMELVAAKALFIKKKKYACLKYWDDDNGRLDKDGKPGKLKAMGLDLKRADTPKFMQEFLEKVLMDLLQGADEANIMEQIKQFRVAFKSRPAWEKGSPKKVSNLTKYGNMLKKSTDVKVASAKKKGEGRVTIPGHVRASINWNYMLDVNQDKYSMRITDGARIVVCKLQKNLLNMDSIAYPIDEPHLPPWFKELPFDHTEMENVIVDKKLGNLLDVLKWDLRASVARNDTADQFFTF